MSGVLRIPTVFYTDHSERDLPTPQIQGIKAGGYLIRLDDPATAELLDDAEHYADPYGPDGGMGLRSSARATAKAIRKAMTKQQQEQQQ